MRLSQWCAGRSVVMRLPLVGLVCVCVCGSGYFKIIQHGLNVIIGKLWWTTQHIVVRYHISLRLSAWDKHRNFAWAFIYIFFSSATVNGNGRTQCRVKKKEKGFFSTRILHSLFRPFIRIPFIANEHFAKNFHFNEFDNEKQNTIPTAIRMQIVQYDFTWGKK